MGGFPTLRTRDNYTIISINLSVGCPFHEMTSCPLTAAYSKTPCYVLSGLHQSEFMNRFTSSGNLISHLGWRRTGVGFSGLCPAIYFLSEFFPHFEKGKFRAAYGYLLARLWIPNGLVPIFSYLERPNAPLEVFPIFPVSNRVFDLARGFGYVLKEGIYLFRTFRFSHTPCIAEGGGSMPDEVIKPAGTRILICEDESLSPGASPELSGLSAMNWLPVLHAIEDATDWGVS
jgi:hypothetical protein